MRKSGRSVQGEGPESAAGGLRPLNRVDRIILEIRKLIAASIFFNAQAAEKAGLGLTDMQMINLLQLFGPATPGRLAEWTGLSSGGVTVALDRLEKAGYIKREPNPADRRSNLATLVPVRMARLERLYEDVDRQTRRLIEALPAADQGAVIRFFDALGSAREKLPPLE